MESESRKGSPKGILFVEVIDHYRLRERESLEEGLARLLYSSQGVPLIRSHQQMQPQPLQLAQHLPPPRNSEVYIKMKEEDTRLQRQLEGLLPSWPDEEGEEGERQQDKQNEAGSGEVRWSEAEIQRADELCVLGLMHEEGILFTKNLSRAFFLMGTAASLGSSVATCVVGARYGSGRGVAVDYNAANRLYKKAARRGNIAAVFNIGESVVCCACESSLISLYRSKL